MKNNQAAGVGLQLLDQFWVSGTCRMDVQCGGGVHGIASLCGEEFEQYQPVVVLCQQLKVVFVSGGLDSLSHFKSLDLAAQSQGMMSI
ncbi:hypothetical protein [Pseudomonas protegens]|uniref:hypothetical protein n=1 Tax=Pseudomonas protegens TaxID=380021 RepID=UPI0015E12482|nr:hypothetical protein [Pseudomonas protegens]